jgi:hypothetical protein
VGNREQITHEGVELDFVVEDYVQPGRRKHFQLAPLA